MYRYTIVAEQDPKKSKLLGEISYQKKSVRSTPSERKVILIWSLPNFGPYFWWKVDQKCEKKLDDLNRDFWLHLLKFDITQTLRVLNRFWWFFCKKSLRFFSFHFCYFQLYRSNFPNDADMPIRWVVTAELRLLVVLLLGVLQAAPFTVMSCESCAATFACKSNNTVKFIPIKILR